jgi:type IV pilus assembly protein PilV
MSTATRRRRQRGLSMIEVLITMVIVAFGLLGLAGFITRATALSVEATQRARASALLSDMSNRLAGNRTKAADYVTGAVQGEAIENDCAGQATPALRDLCEWNNLLAGANDQLAAGATAQALTFRGCVTQPNPADPVFVVTIAWGATLPGTPPADACAAGTFGEDVFRRTLRSQVRVATLTA